MDWVRRFIVEVRWTHARHSHKGVPFYSFTTTSAQHLAQILRWGRANPHVTSCRYRVVWQLEGDLPGVCGRGHRLPVGQARNVARSHSWLTCVCGGHHRIECPECGQVLVEPAPAADCTI